MAQNAPLTFNDSPKQIIFLTATILYGVTVLFTTILFYVKDRSVAISNRSVFLTCFGGVFNIFATTIFLLNITFTATVPCFVNLCACYLGVIPYILCIVARCLRICYLFRINKIKHNQTSKVDLNRSWHVLKPKHDNDRFIRKLMFAIFVVDLIVLIIIEIFSSGPSSAQIFPTIIYSCKAFNWEYYPFYGVIFFYSFVMTPYLFWSMRNVRDSFGIRQELFITSIVAPLSAIMTVGWHFVGQQITYYWHPNLFPVFAFVIAHTVSVTIPLYHVVRSENRPQTKCFDDSAADFQHVLQDDMQFVDLGWHCVSDLCSENYCFIIEYQRLAQRTLKAYADDNKASSVSSEPDTAPPRSILNAITFLHTNMPSRAKTINEMLPASANRAVVGSLRKDYFEFYNTFIARDGMYEVNLSSGVLREVKAKIDDEILSVDMFDAARKEVLDLLFFNSFPRFMENKKAAYQKHLKFNEPSPLWPLPRSKVGVLKNVADDDHHHHQDHEIEMTEVTVI